MRQLAVCLAVLILPCGVAAPSLAQTRPEAVQLAQGEAFVAHIEQMVADGFAELATARTAQNINRINCVNDALTTMNGLLRLATSNLAALRQCVAQADAGCAEHEFIKISIAFNKTEELQGQLLGCGGVAQDGVIDGRPYIEKNISTDADPDLPRVRQADPFDALGTQRHPPIDESSFQATADAPLSTFAIDVDTAAFALVRRMLNDGHLPPQDAVRIEELVNWFPFHYPPPPRDTALAIQADVTAAPWQPSHRLVRVGIQGAALDLSRLPPANLVFLVDVSGSMAGPARLPLVQRALELLVAQLRPQDRVALVVYAGATGLVLPSTPAREQATIRQAIANLAAGGATAGAAGLQLAYQVAAEHFVARGVNRVILCTDGDFNVGATSQAALLAQIERARATGVFLTVLGFGIGNHQDQTLELLADKGNGNHAYIDTLAEARKVLVQELGATLVTVAKDVKIQVEFNPALVKGYRLLGYENRLLAARDFKDDAKDAGELGSGGAVTALYEVVPADSPEPLDGARRLQDQPPRPALAAKSGALATVRVRFKPSDGWFSKELAAAVHDEGRDFASAPEDLRFAAAVAGWGLLLRDSPFKGHATFAGVADWARAAVGSDDQGYRAAFIALVEQSARLQRLARRQ